MDSKSVLNASYNDLKDLGLQAIGDIISLKSFCQRKQESGILGKTPSDIEERKQHLKEILERKSTRPVKRKADDDLQNTTRKIYIGWIHQESIRSTNKGQTSSIETGGGVREQNMPLSASKSDVLETAKSLFFLVVNQNAVVLKMSNFLSHPSVVENLVTPSNYHLEMRFHLLCKTMQKWCVFKGETIPENCKEP